MTKGGAYMINLSDMQNLDQLLISRLSKSDIKQWVQRYAKPYKELMAYYRCAMMEVATKFNVLNEELSLQYDRNPIESIEKNINDIAGVRVICSYPSDMYMLANALLSQDDIKLVEKKDYVDPPKPNGYRSLHLIVETPIFLHDEKRMMKVEVQFRTMSMDWWASLEHKISYKKDIPDELRAQITKELLECAELGASLDKRMEQIQKKVEQQISEAGNG